MNITPDMVGKIVELPAKPEWGPGKITAIEGRRALVRFLKDSEPLRKITLEENPLVLSSNQTVPELDAPKRSLRTGGFTSKRFDRVDLNRLFETMKESYPQGFQDPLYVADERVYKEAKVKQFKELLGEGKLTALIGEGNYQEAGDRVVKVIQNFNLLSVFEMIRFRKLGEAGKGYYTALDRLLNIGEPTQEDYTAYFDAVQEMNVEGFATWPISTVLLFVARPDKFMFLKPESTRFMADSQGLELNYESKPNGRTYWAFLGITEKLLGEVKALGGKDLIDLQSFIFMVFRTLYPRANRGTATPKKRPTGK